MKSISAKQFSQFILNWFDQHGRKDLPWQQNKSPYRVWLSEIMLQQTQVSTVIPYFLKFLKKFPDVFALASALEDEVLHLWTGLGYYSRARNLHRTAKIIVNDFQGEFPREITALEKLPGIGRSTAGAILSIAFEKPAAILDGNVKRVLARFYGITTWPGERKTHDELWKLAEKLMPLTRTADYTQAMMDLGATVCTRSKPVCLQCPLVKNCVAKKLDIISSIPAGKPKKRVPVRKATFFIFKNNNSVILEKRPPTGVWASLWSLPELAEHMITEHTSSNKKILETIKKIFSHKFHFEIEKFFIKDIFRHTFSHFHLDILPVVVSVKKITNKIMENDQQIWYDLENPAAVGLPAPVKRLLEEF